ncbi:damage-inducible protein [Boudabousia liubingyangii]|uniref:Damage-inducible protein n=1 Tax=Boudabousia liubingyangii TaxID=1921764 RepID=A0A1Q5PQV3_9ACTO|nr:damage-inducible protein [Boudabousia liubingyangii]
MDALEARAEATRSVHAFDALLDEYRALAPTERDKGNYFEGLIAQYLRHDSQMRSQIADVYLWKDWSGRQGRGDCGIDLVAIPADDPDGAVAVQCKFYAPGHKIQKSDVDSFLSESGKHPFTRRIFVETTGVPWGSNAEAAIEGQQIPVTRVGLTDLRNSDIDWSTYTLTRPEKDAQTQERKTLRDHQVTAIKDVFAGFESNDRGTLVMACGTGKTFTSLKIAERLAEKNGGVARVLFMVPSLALMSQTLQEWSAECELPFMAWSVCSDSKVNKRQANADLQDMVVADLKIPATTDGVKLAASLKRENDREGLQVVFSTYQSIDAVHEAQEAGGDAWRDFDLIICDEAHRTTGVTLSGEDESHFVKVHDSSFLRAEKRLYMTATPRLFKDEVKNAAKEKDAILASMDDESIYGPVFHKLGFGQAVALGLLTDYKVVVLAVPEEEVSGIYQAQTALDGELSLPETAKLVGCWNVLSKRKGKTHDVEYGSDLSPMRRAVAFCKDIKTSKWVTNEFATLVSEHLQDLTNDDDTDNLEVQCQHVDGSMNAVTRGEALDWLKADAGDEIVPVCRVLTNARCLSEGVDVPTLDAVLFLNPRKSQVDVIQAVGRVMRKAPGKEFGYIVLPVAIPVGATPESALEDNKRYQVIWQVLQAIRAHDERFDATINSIEYNNQEPENIIVDVIDLSPKKDRNSGGDHLDGSDKGNTTEGDPVIDGGSELRPIQIAFNFGAEDWKDAVYSRIVKKVGSRLYWDDWSKDIADIASRYINLIESLLEDQQHKDDFLNFVQALRETLNPNIDNAQAVEMLAQHLITKPLFDAMFDDQQFTQQNPVSQAMQGIVDRLASNEVFEKERRPLEKFYAAMVERIKQVDNLSGKQQIMLTLFDKFFSKAFPNMADRLGIVFTPVPVVDYIIHSANEALKTAFGKTLGDKGVALIEPFVGTGTFVSRLLQSGIIAPEQLEYKYKHEIFANEIVLLSYYIASINIESVYREIRREQGFDDGYEEFEGISLTDTFQLHETDGTVLKNAPGFDENLERAKRQKQAPIRVILMNPPYSAGQSSANDNNQNLKYPVLDKRIEASYVARSTGTNKNSLYDSYFRAIRWATDRIGDEGVIAFVSNSSFIDGNTADGVRLSWQSEFSDIFIYNLRGGIRGKIGETAKREGGNVFDIMTGVAIAVLVKTRDHSGPATIHYAETDDGATRQEKLNTLEAEKSLSGTDFQIIIPNEAGDWINQRDEKYTTYQTIGDKVTKGKETSIGIFRNYSGGLKTNRDSWCYNFSSDALADNIRRMINNYNSCVENGVKTGTVDTNPALVSWNRQLFKDLDSGKHHVFDQDSIVPSLYRPFCKQAVYFNRAMNDMVYQLPQLFPTPAHRNLGFVATGDYRKNWSHLSVADIPDLNILSANMFFPLFTWEKLESGSGEPDLFTAWTTSSDETANFEPSVPFDFTRPISRQIPEHLDGYTRRDNITDGTLQAYRQHYGDQTIGKEDIFFYVYALLHHPEYRSRYVADLKKMLPRIPKCAGFWEYVNAGRELADLHVNYEYVQRYDLTEEWKMDAPEDPWQRYEVSKPTWAKRADHTSLKYNQYLTLHGIPEAAQDYQVNGRSPLEWVIDRYKVTVDKKSGIKNDPNDYCREVGKPDYIVDLIKRLVTVSIETQRLVSLLPALEIMDK